MFLQTNFHRDTLWRRLQLALPAKTVMKENVFIEYIRNEKHYSSVLKQCKHAEKELWVSAAGIAQTAIAYGQWLKPFYMVVSELLSRRVSVRLLHTKEPGKAHLQEFKQHPMRHHLDEKVCPKANFNLLIFDSKMVYIGSACLADMNMKMPVDHSYEAGILTNNPQIVQSAKEQFDDAWNSGSVK